MNKYKLRYIIFITLNLINILIYPFINYAGIVEIHYELWLGIVLVYMPAAAFILSLIYGMIFKGYALFMLISIIYGVIILMFYPLFGNGIHDKLISFAVISLIYMFIFIVGISFGILLNFLCDKILQLIKNR